MKLTNDFLKLFYIENGVTNERLKSGFSFFLLCVCYGNQARNQGGGCKGAGVPPFLLKGGCNDEYKRNYFSYFSKIQLEFEKLVKRKKFIHLFWNIIAIFGSFKNIVLSKDICHFQSKQKSFFLSTLKFTKNVSISQCQ